MRITSLAPLLLLALPACKQDAPPVENRLVRTLVVDLKAVGNERQAIGEVRPRFESDLSFRVAGKVHSRVVDVGARVKQGDRLATLDADDYQNRLRSAKAEVTSAQAALVEAQGAEDRQAKLLKDGWTTKASYDTALRNLRVAEAKLAVVKASLDLARDQVRYTELKADFDGVITSVSAEAGQNVTAGQTVVKLAKPDDKDAVFTIAETAFTDLPGAHPEVVVWPLSNLGLEVEGVAREISPVADPATRTYTVKVTLKDPPPQIRFGMSIGGRVKGHSALGVALPLSALFEKNGSPAVWVVDPHSGSLSLRPVTVARYDAKSAVIASGIAKGEVVVTAGVNTLRLGQTVRLTKTSGGTENEDL